jgi:hypothetical protein
MSDWYDILWVEVETMTEPIATLPTPKTTADYKAVIDLLLNEMLRIEAQMQLSSSAQFGRRNS